MTLEKKKLDNALSNSIKDGAAYAAMDGITTTYTTPFALALGASGFYIGILNSVPQFFVTLSQMFISKYIEKFGTKRVTTTLSLVQKLSWFLIMLLPLIALQDKLLFFILLITVANVVLGLSLTAWSSWMGNLVPEKIRGSYFGKRSMVVSMFSFVTTLVAGWILNLTGSLEGFSLIFFLAFLFGMTSYYYLKKIPEVGCSGVKSKRMSVLKFSKELKKQKNFRPFARHMAMMSFAVNIASPFFIVYMLNVMGISYAWFGIVTAIEILTKIVMMRHWGKLSDKFGDRTVMALCNIFIIFYPFFFIFVKTPLHLILLSVFSGMCWSGFDLTSFNYLLDVTPGEKRPSYIANYKIYVGISLFLAPLIGGALSQFFIGKYLFWLNGLQLLFLLSFILRLFVTAYGLPSLEEVRAKKTIPVTNVFMKAFVTYPIRGISRNIIFFERKVGSAEKSLKKSIAYKIKEIV